MSDLRELYQEVILDHGKRPRNFRVLEDADGQAEGFNPLCGDRVTIYVKLRGGVIEDVAFQGAGCAISTASASMMTNSLKGRTTVEAEELFARFQAMITGTGNHADEDLGNLGALAGVKEFPTRVKCASLAWHTLRAALKGDHPRVTTE
jgi:nitrogen fixation NifU-like protein